MYLDLNYQPDSYGGIDYRLIFDGESFSGFLTQRGIKQAYDLGKKLFDVEYSNKIINDFSDFNKSVTDKSMFHLVDNKLSRIEQFGLIKNKIKWLSKYYLHCEQPVLAPLEEYLITKIKDNNKLNQILKNPKKFKLDQKTEYVVNVLNRLGEEKLIAHKKLGEIKAIVKFSRYISKKYNIKMKYIFAMREKEIDAALSGKKVDFKKIEQRLNGFVFLPPKKGKVWQCAVGEEYEKWKLELLSSYGNIVKGMIAHQGKARGKVFIHQSFVKMSNVPPRTILVSGMTNPQMVPFLKNVIAIVTDEGGLTCHAAIIARELKIPCIVGTGNATQVLKNGDEVEVDAERGIVKIISK